MQFWNWLNFEALKSKVRMIWLDFRVKSTQPQLQPQIQTQIMHT